MRNLGLPGKVYLTGAGPGSAKLLTLRAMEVLKNADIVFHDDLVSTEVLALIPAHVAVHNVGKRCGPKKISQEEIQQRLIRAARSGQSVVRLKGGDPLIFGRAQEEIAALRKAAIPFEIVPGVTAACAAAAAAEISLTDRRGASKLVFISNHRCAQKDARNWNAALMDSTLVFYMPGRQLESLQGDLLANGLDADVPCLIISRATLATQKVIHTTIGGLASAPREEAPSLLVVGLTCSEARADLHAASKPHREQRGAQEETILDLEPRAELLSN